MGIFGNRAVVAVARAHLNFCVVVAADDSDSDVLPHRAAMPVIELLVTLPLWLVVAAAELADAEGEEDIASQEHAEVSYNPGAGWNVDWSDEFEGNSLNGANWNVLNSNYDPVTNNCNFGTGELEYPRASNVTDAQSALRNVSTRAMSRPSGPGPWCTSVW